MKDSTYGPLVIGLSLIVAIILIALACSSPPTVNTAPCCGEVECDTYESEVIESIEEPDLTRDYEGIQTGSHDFFLGGTDLVPTQCVTCLVYFPSETYGEHIKTCCP